MELINRITTTENHSLPSTTTSTTTESQSATTTEDTSPLLTDAETEAPKITTHPPNSETTDHVTDQHRNEDDRPDNSSVTSMPIEDQVTTSSTTTTTSQNELNEDERLDEEDENEIDQDVDQDGDDDEEEDNDDDDDDNENNESNDLTIAGHSGSIQQSTDCGANRGGCDHECWIIFDQLPSDERRVGRPVCSCRSGFTLDANDQRTCHGKCAI